MNNICIIGSFDRYNYGDLLFPLILEHMIQHNYDNCKISYFGMQKSQMDTVGGKNTMPLSDLLAQEKATIIIAGGEVIGAPIGWLDIALSKSEIEVWVKRIFKKLIGNNRYNKFCCIKYGVDWKYPWTIDKKIYKNASRIIYNSVGANNLKDLDRRELDDIRIVLSTADYISVRDDNSRMMIQNENVLLYPDSATSMSYVFTQDKLEKLSTNFVFDFVSEKRKYLCLQFNFDFYKKNSKKTIISQIKKIIEYGYEVVLLPIGFASMHSDVIALNNLYNELMDFEDIHFFAEVNIFDIMYLISNSIFFAGTSLHGNITAMSYGVRHIGIDKSIDKLCNYLYKWDIEEQKKCIDISDLYSTFVRILKVEDKKLKDNCEYLLKLSEENLNNILKGIE